MNQTHVLKNAPKSDARHGLIVTRHAQAVRWIQQHVTGLPLEVTSHLTEESWQTLGGNKPTDLFGVLPLNWMARVQREGVRCWLIELDLPPSLRGQELSADDMTAHGAALVAYRVEALGQWPSAAN